MQSNIPTRNSCPKHRVCAAQCQKNIASNPRNKRARDGDRCLPRRHRDSHEAQDKMLVTSVSDRPIRRPWGGRIPGGRNGNPLQDSCLENPMDRGAWGAAVHGVTKSQTRLKQLSTHLAIRSSVWYNAANSIMNGQTDFILSAGQRQTTVMRCH